MPAPAKTVEIAPGIRWVGIEDFNRRVFDSLVTLPYGTSYNAYLVSGKNQTALIDTTGPGFEDEFLAKIATIVSPSKLDYVVMNHAEPDHAGAIPVILSAAPDARLVVTRKGAEIAESFYHVPEARRLVVKEGDIIDLGGKTLRFIEAPWLHWPETMFTFTIENKVLFSCDFFGTHMASDKLFDDEVSENLIPEAKRYFAEIMMPYTKMATAGLDKASATAPQVIAPSHGPIYRNPRRILAAYEQWLKGSLAKKIIIAYASMWGNTGRMAKAITDAISLEGVEAVPYDLLGADISHIARDLVDASAIILGSSTLLGGLHPLAANALFLVKALRPRVKLAAFFGSYGWGGGAARQAKEMLESAGFEILEVLDVKGAPTDTNIEAARELGRKVAVRIKGQI